MPVLSRRASFWTAAATAAIALWTSGAPTVTYPLYAEAWQLTPAVTTAIFAVYPIVLVVTLLVFGDLSDYLGRRAAILIGLAASAVGVLLFAIAPDIAWVFAGRALMGIGVGLSLSPATAAVVEFSAEGRGSRAGSVVTASTATGLALATLVGGALVEYAPLPLHLNYWVLLAVIAVVAAAAWFLPRRMPTGSSRRWRPRAIRVPVELRGVVAAAALSVAAAYAIGAIMLSLGAQIAKQLIGSDNAFVTGAILSVSAVVIGLVALASRSLAPRLAISGGAIATGAGLALLALAAVSRSIPLFLAASAVTGVGYSLLFSGGLGLVTRWAPVHHRAGTLSAVYLVGYLVQGAAALALGASATGAGLTTAVDAGGIGIAVLGILAAVLVLTVGRTVRPAPLEGN